MTTDPTREYAPADRNDPNRHLPAHPRSQHCTSSCLNVDTRFADEAFEVRAGAP